MVPSHLTPCLIHEANFVVNARGQIFKAVPEGHNSLFIWMHGHEYSNTHANRFEQEGLYNACLIPCRQIPKKPFERAVSPQLIADYPALQGPSAFISFGANTLFFKSADLEGIEDVPIGELQLVLERKPK